jgi:hypothetical protein
MATVQTTACKEYVCFVHQLANGGGLLQCAEQEIQLLQPWLFGHRITAANITCEQLPTAGIALCGAYVCAANMLVQ